MPGSYTGYLRRLLRKGSTGGRLVLLTTGGAGCGIVGGDCTSVARLAVDITIVDKATKQAPSGLPTITISDGDFTFVYPPAGQVAAVLPSYAFLPERPGGYSVKVEVPGYVVWERHGIEVDYGGHCQELQTARFRVDLVWTCPEKVDAYVKGTTRPSVTALRTLPD